MSLSLDTAVAFIGAIAPITFGIAVGIGVVGNLLYGWFYRSWLHRQVSQVHDLEKVLAGVQYNRFTDRTFTTQDMDRLVTCLELMSLDDKLIDQAFGTDRVASRLARLGEYLSNHNPADPLTRGAVK